MNKNGVVFLLTFFCALWSVGVNADSGVTCKVTDSSSKDLGGCSIPLGSDVSPLTCALVSADDDTPSMQFSITRANLKFGTAMSAQAKVMAKNGTLKTSDPLKVGEQGRFYKNSLQKIDKDYSFYCFSYDEMNFDANAAKPGPKLRR